MKKLIIICFIMLLFVFGSCGVTLVPATYADYIDTPVYAEGKYYYVDTTYYDNWEYLITDSGQEDLVVSERKHAINTVKKFLSIVVIIFTLVILINK